MGSAKYAAKYQKTLDTIANHIQRDYKGGPEIAKKAIRDMLVPVINVPPYPTPANPGDEVDPGAKFIWQQEVQEAMKMIALLVENKKQAYALILGQCSPELVSKIQGLNAYVQADADQGSF